MKVNRLEQDTVRLHIDDMDDLWYLKNILSTGDLVTMTAMRRVEKQDDMTRSKETRRKPVTVTIQVETIEFQEFSNRLKLLGTITSGSEDIAGEHQSFIVNVDDDLKITKTDWGELQKNLLKESEERAQKIMGIFVTLDDDSSDVVVMRSYGLQSMGRIESRKTGKMYDTQYSEKDYFNEISNVLKQMPGETEMISVLGPGFTRDHLTKYLGEDPFYKSKIIKSSPTGRSDIGAVYEYLESEESKKAFENARISKETELFNRFLKELNGTGLCAYGKEDVRKALDYGAVDTLMISESVISDRATDNISDTAKKSSTEVYIFSEITEPGKMLKKFGGYCAVLRYKI